MVLHLADDAVASLGVAVSGVAIAVTGGWYRLDPAVSLAIAALIAWRAVGLLRAAGGVLLEAVPAGLDLNRPTATIRAECDVSANDHGSNVTVGDLPAGQGRLAPSARGRS